MLRMTDDDALSLRVVLIRTTRSTVDGERKREDDGSATTGVERRCRR